jgi:ABC-2 type transport system ATP-binding protein
MVRRRRWRQETHRHGVFRKKQQEERQRRIPKEQPKQSKNNPEIYDDFERIDNFQLIGDQDIEIQVSGVTMDYRQEKDEASSFKELFIKSIKGKRHVKTFRALDNISFNVRRGEILGIIGTNGSGKTTLLKIISGVLPPTKGQVKVDRSKVQLLTLGTGFDMELTGRENVYLNGALIGYSRKYIDEHYNEIVSFAELEDFMEEKVKTYSSGMISRLGFAIATAREAPGILILDEVLSVGDIHFSKKSKARINELIHSGSTVLIVSHSLGTIREKCTRAIWIEKSKLMKQGDVKHVCEAYEKKDL